MSSPYNDFAQKEKKKVDFDTATLDYGDYKIMVKHTGSESRAFINAFNAKMRPLERRAKLDRDGELSEAASKALEKARQQAFAEVYADTVIVGWEGVKDAKGKKIEYNRENVIKLLTDLPALLLDIIDQAAYHGNFYKQEVEQEAKNSEKS